jgi:hypothetical protein
MYCSSLDHKSEYAPSTTYSFMSWLNCCRRASMRLSTPPTRRPMVRGVLGFSLEMRAGYEGHFFPALVSMKKASLGRPWPD